MTALGEFLERFYGPDELFDTVHARGATPGWLRPRVRSNGSGDHPLAVIAEMPSRTVNRRKT